MEVSLQSFKKRFTYDPQKDLLGKGGFGEVYKAYDTEDHIFVALKISQGTADDKYNLISEIKRFKKLNHPNIVKHIEAYEVNTGSSDIHGKPIAYHVGILEYADKGTLADLLKKGKPDYRLIEDLAKDIIEGLAYLHDNNIIHRDLKPSNILLFSEGEKLRAKITDFGIAKRTDTTAASTQLVGTVEYMAPEFFTTGNITPASDVWSVGVMLLEALTGTHPFGKTSQGMGNEQIIANVLNKDLNTATQNLTEPLKKIIIDCIRREPVLRPQSAEALKAELTYPSVDSFAEKTQVIELKKSPSKIQTNEPKWKRWRKALFDFELSNGRWKKFIAKELIVFLVVGAFSILLPILLATVLYAISRVEKNKIEPELTIINHQLDSLQSIIDRPYEFSNSYFGWHKNDSSLLYTDLGVVYSNLCNSISMDKLNFDSKLKNIARFEGRYDSYFSFVEYARNKLKYDDQIWLVSLQSVLRDQGESWKNFDLASAIKSINNLSIDMPNDGSENLSLFPNYKFEPRYFRDEVEKRISIPGWIDWFFDYRVNKNGPFKYYLKKWNLKERSEFASFFSEISIVDGDFFRQSYKLKKRKQELLDKLDKSEELWGLNRVSDDDVVGYFAIILFMFYPLRLTFMIILWAVKTLRN